MRKPKLKRLLIVPRIIIEEKNLSLSVLLFCVVQKSFYEKNEKRKKIIRRKARSLFVPVVLSDFVK